MASINKTPSVMSTWVLGRGGADLNGQDCPGHVQDVQEGQKPTGTGGFWGEKWNGTACLGGGGQPL